MLWGSVDFHGHEPDRFEYKFTDVQNSMSVAANRMNVPPTWIVLSNISGPACATIIQEGRNSGAICQSPDQAMQFGQLAALHSSWFPGSTAQRDDADRPPEARSVRTLGGDDRQNLHVIVDAPLFFIKRMVVAGEALALGAHDQNIQADAVILAPSRGLGLVILAAPQGADDPAVAVGLAPLIYNAQRQPDMALGLVSRDEAPEHLFGRPAAIEMQTPLQLPGAVRPAAAQEYATPLISPAVEQRRDRATGPPKAPPPLRPDCALQGISAATSLAEMIANNADLNRVPMGAARQIMPGQSSTTVQELDEAGQPTRPDRYVQIFEIRQRLTALQGTEAGHAIRAEACTRHLETMHQYLQFAVTQNESEGFIANYQGLLNLSEIALNEAVAQVAAIAATKLGMENLLADLLANADGE